MSGQKDEVTRPQDRPECGPWTPGVRAISRPCRSLRRRRICRNGGSAGPRARGPVWPSDGSSASIPAGSARTLSFSIRTASPRGAVVVGLGQPADLSIGMLRETLRQGVLAYRGRDAGSRLRKRGRIGPETGTRPELPSRRRRRGRRRSHQLRAGAASGRARRTRCSAGCRTAPRLALSKSSNSSRIAHTRPGAAAKKAIDGDPVLKSVFWSPLEFVPRGGGRRRAPLGEDPNWWQPIQITMPRGDPKDRSLSFTVGGGFARAEARTIAANLDIVEPLLRRSARNVDIDGSPTSPGRILFELLWPESLKQRSAEEQHRRLILDEQSAAFPWELLDDRRPWTSDDGGH